MNASKTYIITGLAVAVSLTPSAHAISGCTNAWLNGQFGMQISGSSAPAVAGSVGGIPVPTRMASDAASSGPASRAPVVGIARLNLDGDGNLSGYSAISLNGVWLQGNVSGSYAVNQDCSATFTITDASGNAEHFGGTIVGQGDSALMMQTDAGTGVSGTLKRVRGFCQTSDVFGSFGLQYSGSVLAQADGGYSSVGIASLDGQGNITTAESRYSAGSYSQMSSAGTVVINSDCTASITLASNGASPTSMNFLALVSFDQKQLVFIQSDAGTATNGSLIAQ